MVVACPTFSRCFPWVRALERRVDTLEAQLTQCRGELEHMQLRGAHLEDSALLRRYECKICMDRIVTSVFLPCGHTLCCDVCAAKAARCPVCACEVTQVTKIHFS